MPLARYLIAYYPMRHNMEELQATAVRLSRELDSVEGIKYLEINPSEGSISFHVEFANEKQLVRRATQLKALVGEYRKPWRAEEIDDV